MPARIGDLMFAPDEPRVIGVLDWELSTIGHPLLDVAYAVLMHELPIDVVRGMGGQCRTPDGRRHPNGR